MPMEFLPNKTEESCPYSPVEVGSISHFLQGFVHPSWLAGFLNHQQYQYMMCASKIMQDAEVARQQGNEHFKASCKFPSGWKPPECLCS